MSSIWCTTLCQRLSAFDLLCTLVVFCFDLFIFSEPNFPNILLSGVSIQRMNSGGEKMARDIALATMAKETDCPGWMR